MKAQETLKTINPFLRWTGSKRWFIKDHIDKFLPEKFNNYHEPFLGGGAVFFHISQFMPNKRFYLSDSNEELINCYNQIKYNPEKVIAHLKSFKNNEEAYYTIRKLSPKKLEKKAARFIYLNRTSFNGIYRVNSYGEYNVPYGHRPNVDVTTKDLLLNISAHLQRVSINCLGFEDSIKGIRENDLVFIDPPYTIAHENNGFIEYNQKLFSWDDQIRLKEYVEKIIAKKAFFILTNASHHSIAELYKDIGMFTLLSRESKVGGRNKTRGNFNEIVIYNTK